MKVLAVSYTHLELKAGDFVPLTTEERRKLKNYIKDAGPVSYTHLDVYKRQAH